jgi:RNA polymerase sigma factor (TIGR02999 family)
VTTEDLFEELYQDLRRMASVRMRGERKGHTLQTTALVNEAYLRMSSSQASGWQSRQHFLAAAALVMRRILVDHARKRNRRVRLISGFEGTDGLVPDGTEFSLISRALEALAREHPRQAFVLELRYILGLGAGEVAEVLEVSSRTVNEDTRFGLAWIRRYLSHRSGVPD